MFIFVQSLLVAGFQQSYLAVYFVYYHLNQSLFLFLEVLLLLLYDIHHVLSSTQRGQVFIYLALVPLQVSLC